MQWIAVGYSIAFSPGSAWIGGLSWAGFTGVRGDPNPTHAATIPHLPFATFQSMFAAITIAFGDSVLIPLAEVGGDTSALRRAKM